MVKVIGQLGKPHSEQDQERVLKGGGPSLLNGRSLESAGDGGTR